MKKRSTQLDTLQLKKKTALTSVIQEMDDRQKHYYKKY
jgi:hypothetical protein